jgi:signal transduction histidine kinase
MPVDFEATIAERISRNHSELAARWFARLFDLLPVGARDIFPTDSLLDHIPSLILEIGSYVADPERHAIAANTVLLEKARELGTLRHRQKASLHQVLREYQILGAVLTTFVSEEIEALQLTPAPTALAALMLHLQQAVNLLAQTTADTFISLYTATITDQARRLEEFARLAVHEWRTPLATVRTAVTILQMNGIDHPRAQEVLASADRSVTRLIHLTNDLERMARLDRADTPALQLTDVGAVAREAARHLREMAEARGVDIAIQADTPQLVVDVARLELVFVNLLSNAIKYSDPQERDRRVAVTMHADEDEGHWVIDVEDNGIGIAEEHLVPIFKRFTRAHRDRDEALGSTGLGLGLSIAEDCVRVMGGSISVRSVVGEGTVFSFTLPASPQFTGGEPTAGAPAE